MVLLAACKSPQATAAQDPHDQAASSRPCDIYAAAKTPCVAAYSPARALFAAYRGRLCTGSFFEGVMTAGYSTNAADNAVQADVVAQHYG